MERGGPAGAVQAWWTSPVPGGRHPQRPRQGQGAGPCAKTLEQSQARGCSRRLESARAIKYTQFYEVELDKKRATLTHEGIEAAQTRGGRSGSFYVGENVDIPHLLGERRFVRTRCTSATATTWSRRMRTVTLGVDHRRPEHRAQDDRPAVVGWSAPGPLRRRKAFRSSRKPRPWPRSPSRTTSSSLRQASPA